VRPDSAPDRAAVGRAGEAVEAVSVLTLASLRVVTAAGEGDADKEKTRDRGPFRPASATAP